MRHGRPPPRSSGRRPRLGGTCTACCCRSTRDCWTRTPGRGSGPSAWCWATSSPVNEGTAGTPPGGRTAPTTPKIRRSPPDPPRRVPRRGPRRGNHRSRGDEFDQLRQRLDMILDLSAERLAGLPDNRLDLGARWSGFPVTVGFRIGHAAPRTCASTRIQVEKTFALLGHVPDERARLARHVLAAYGRAESVVFGREGIARRRRSDRRRSRGSPSGDRFRAGSPRSRRRSRVDMSR